jgi:hypothetical protein
VVVLRKVGYVAQMEIRLVAVQENVAFTLQTFLISTV